MKRSLRLQTCRNRAPRAHFKAPAAIQEGPIGQRLSTGQVITREVTRSVTNRVVGKIAADIGKSIGGSMGGSVGRAIVRGALGGILRR